MSGKFAVRKIDVPVIHDKEYSLIAISIGTAIIPDQRFQILLTFNQERSLVINVFPIQIIIKKTESQQLKDLHEVRCIRHFPLSKLNLLKLTS